MIAYCQKRVPLILFSAVLLIVTHDLAASTYYVSTTGVDDADRNGTTTASAWKTLAYACTRVPEGGNEISLGAGIFTETQSSHPQSGVTITGSGKSGNNATIIKASTAWAISGNPSAFNTSNYLISVKTWDMGYTSRANHITISNVQMISDPTHKIDGALFFWDCDAITLHDISIKDFRWSGAYFAFDSLINMYNCDITNCAVQEDGYWSGNIHTRWINHSTFHDISSINNISGNWGCGYKGGGHEAVKFYNCTFSGEGFSMEIPFESEYGIEIYGCQFSSPISIPKEMGDNPASHGQTYSFWIHDNYSTSSYTMEGPRNNLIFDHNFIQISTNTGGRCYSQFGGDTKGPLLFHHNVIENCDRAFIWKGAGELDSVHVYNNTVYCANAADRAASILDSWDNMAGWDVRNNIFVAPSSQHRTLGSANLINATNNVCYNIDNVPTGNFANQDPQLALSGTKPAQYYAAASANSFVVDKGVDVGLPYSGSAPDIGAYEWGGTTAINRPLSNVNNKPVKTWARFDQRGKRFYFVTPNKEANLSLTVRIHSIDGREVASAFIPANGTGAVELDRLAAGKYVVDIRDNHRSLGEQQIVIR